MAGNETHTNRRRIWPWLLIPLALLILAAGLRLAVRSDWVMDYVRNQATEIANEQINGRVSIGSMEGDLLFGLRISEIELYDTTGTPVLQVDSMRIGYSLLKLLREPHEVNDLLIYGLRADVRQQQDGNWNLQTLLKESVDSVETSEPLSWVIHNLRLNNSHIHTEADFFPDGQLDINNLFAGLSNFGYNQEWSGVLRQLEFSFPDSQMTQSLTSSGSQSVGVGASALVDDDHITLNRLAVYTGQSFLEAHASLEQLSRIEGELTLNPLSWQDLTAIADLPVEHDLDIGVEFRGTLPELYIGLNISSIGLDRLFLELSSNLETPYNLEWANLSIEGFNGPVFTGDTTAPSIESFSLEGVGNIPFDNPQAARFTGSFSSGLLNVDAQSTDRTEGSFEFEEGRGNIIAELFNNGQRLAVNVSFSEFFTDTPQWAVNADGVDINPADWLGDPAMDSDLTFSASASGNGFELSSRPVNISASLTNSRIGNVSSANLSFDGTLTDSEIAGELQGSMNEDNVSASNLHAEFTLDNWQSDPTYRFTARAEEVNLANITTLSDFPTWLNAEITGQGAGFSLEELAMDATVRIDSSIVNDERIEQLRATINIQDEYVTVSDMNLQSTIMDGTLSARQHLSRTEDPDNRLDFDLTIKSIASLAPLFDIQNLEAHGTVTGSMTRSESGLPQLQSVLSLEQIAYDTLYSAETIDGTISLVMADTTLVNADIEVSQAAYDSLSINTLLIQTESTLSDSLTEGSLQITLVQNSETSVTHGGHYRYRTGNGDIFLQTNRLDITTPVRTLSLQQPSDLIYQDEHLEMTLLSLLSDDENATLELTIPWLDQHRQEVQFNAERLNLGTLQQSLLGEVYAEALLSGRLSLERNERRVHAESELILTQIEINETPVDSLITRVSVSDGRMGISGGAWNLNQQLYSIDVNLPFEPVDPASLGDEFFERPVSGTMVVDNVSGTYLSSLFNYTSENRIDGRVQFDGVIGGTAGNPEFTGNLNLVESMFSGVSVDSLNVDIRYSHENEEVELEGFIESLNTQVAQFNANFPLYIDLRHFTVNLPDETDHFSLNLVTDAFNLSLLNSFISNDLIENLTGTIDGSLDVSGPFSSPRPSGFLTLRNGRVRVIPAAITLRDIQFDIRFDQDRVDLELLSVRSHQGTLTADGFIELEELTPGTMNIDLQAGQFRIANRPDLNAIVDLDGILTGTMTRPEINGSVSFRNGYIYLQNFGEDSVEEVALEGEEEQTNVAVYDSMAITMAVSFDEQFYIRNRQYLDLEVELEGLVDLVKESGGDLEMFGSLQGVSGYARPLGREFDLETAQVTFYGPIENPELNIRTLYRPPQSGENIRIWYIVEGTVDDPEFRFESQPTLELQDIISYTIFGQPFYALDSWAQVISTDGNSTSITDVTLDLLLDRVETLATRQLGIDVVRIDNTRTGSGSTTSIQTGWYLNERTFFAISNEISTTPQTLFILEYMLTENLELILSQGNDSREGIDLRWTLDY